MSKRFAQFANYAAEVSGHPSIFGGGADPPYDINAPAGPKARAIRAAANAAARTLDLRADAIVPIAMPPGRESYNIDSGRGSRRPSTVAACSLPAALSVISRTSTNVSS
jgi:hypothetical protein